MMPKKRANPTQQAPKTEEDVKPVERQGGKRVVRGSWGKLKLRYSKRNEEFDESRDS